jgi:ATP-dependent DNA ligase
MVQREGPRVRLFTRQGYDWSGRFPLISEAARKLKTASCVIDGEAVWLDENGLSHFDRLHGRKHFGEVGFVAFDLLAVDGDDIRDQPLHARKARLAKLLAKSRDGIQINEHMAGEIGPEMFEHACKLGLEGIVSKHRDRAYRAGPCAHWIKIKNPNSPAMRRAKDGTF